MTFQTISIGDSKIAQIIAGEIIIHSAADGLNLLGDLYYQGFDKIMIPETSLTPDFFDLKNGMAGEILQKFSNYRVKLAVVGDFKKYKGKSISGFILESNKGGQVNFVSSEADAITALSKI